MSILIGIETAIRSLRAHSFALDTVSHNISNKNTVGYSRQLSVFATTEPLTNITPPGQIGTGVKVANIERIRDLYLDRQIRSELQNVGKWEILQRTFENLKALFPEIDDPTAPGIKTQLQAFWKSWEALANKVDIDPLNITAEKIEVYNRAYELTSLLNNRASGLIGLQQDLNNEMRTTMEKINTYLKLIAELNKQIVNIYAIGQQPNDLLDKRTQALAELSKLMNLNIETRTDGSVFIHVHGHTLVDGGKYNSLTYIAGKKDSKFERIGLYEYQGARPVDITDKIYEGRLGGLLMGCDQVVSWYRTQLDTLANSLITVVNKVHRGATSSDPTLAFPIDFFTGTRATDINVNLQLNKGLNIAAYTNIVTGYTGATPNTSKMNIAKLIANLDNKLMNSWVQSNNQNIYSYTYIGTNGAIPAANQLGLGSGQIIIGGVTVPYYDTDTIGALVNRINSINPEKFVAIYIDSNSNPKDPAERGLYIFSNEALTIEELGDTSPLITNAGNMTLRRLNLEQRIYSASPINYENAIEGNQIYEFQPPLNFYTWDRQKNKFDIEAKDPGSSVGPPPKYLGSVNIIYRGAQYDVKWGVIQPIASTRSAITAVTGSGDFVEESQKFFFGSRVISTNGNQDHSLQPFFISDKDGNLLQAIKFITNTRFEDFYDSIVSALEGEANSANNILAEYQAAVNQLQALQDDITHVNEEQELMLAKQYQRAYDAAVRLMAVIDQMLNMLINRTATSDSNWNEI